MADSFAQLITSLPIVSPADDLLQQIKVNLLEHNDKQQSAFVFQSFEPLLSLERWAWRSLSEHVNRPVAIELLNTLGDFNFKLIFNTQNIQAKVKFSLLVPENIQWIDRIFEQIQKIEDHNDPFLVIINRWFHNLSYLIHQHEQLETLPVLIYICRYIGDHYLFSDEYQSYLTQLRQSQISPETFTAKQSFYITTCSFLVRMYVNSKSDKLLFKGEDIFQRYGNDYLQIIIIHSSSVSSWSEELLACITHLMDFFCACCWWGGTQAIHIKKLLSSKELCHQYIQAIIQIVGHKPFQESIASQWSNDRTILIDSILTFLLGALTEMKNLSVFLRSETSLSDIVLTIAQNSPYGRISLCAYGIVAEVLSDEQLKELKLIDEISQFFFRILEMAWNNPSQQLLTGLLILSKNDAIQQKTADANKIPLLIKMSEQYPVVFNIIWALSFNKNIQEQLRSNQSFMQTLQTLKKENNDVKMNKTISGILWNLDSKRQDRASLKPTTEKQFDAMISYSHRDEAMCKRIYEDLVKNGYRIWIDFDRIHGNFMDAMAEAIEQSSVILICMSEQYRRSNYCRAEATFAFQRELKLVPILLQEHYQPDGWLLFIIGQLLYVDFTHDAFPRAMDNLVKELKAVTGQEEPVKPVQPETDTSTVDPASIVLPDQIEDWTQANVQSWLLDDNLRQIARLLTDFDGRSLNSLSELITRTNQDTVLRLFDEDCKRRIDESVSLTELARFRALLGEKQEPAMQKKNRVRSLCGCQVM